MKSTQEIRLVFLGGVGEIGMNCMAIETPDGIVIVDCGVMFTPGRYFGPDLAIPDLRYFRANKDRIAGVVVTHGHEDHIGAIPVAFGGYGVPIYAPPFAQALLKEKSLEFQDHGPIELSKIAPGDTIELAGLKFEFFRVTHSIPDALGVIIHTPQGQIVHTGDFRIDTSPTLGEPFDVERLKQAGEEGVLLLLSDSTNVERAGRTEPESWVAEGIEKIVSQHRGRVIVSMFSSNIERTRQLALVARKTGRKLGIVGRSLYSYSRTALETGFGPFDPNSLVDPYFADELPGEDLMVLISGSQGEPRSALTRAALGDHKDVTIRQGDLVIYSSRIIPGNEREIIRVSNGLVREGARVVHERSAQVHTSGHARRDELMDVLEWVKPRYFIPVHGEYRYLDAHARLAEDAVDTTSILADAGSVISIKRGKVRHDETMDLQTFYIEGPLVGNQEELKLSERRRLLFNGLVTVSCRVKRQRKWLSLSQQINLFGIPDPNGSLVNEIRSALKHQFANRVRSLSAQTIEDEVRTTVRRTVKKQQKRRPVVHVDVISTSGAS